MTEDRGIWHKRVWAWMLVLLAFQSWAAWAQQSASSETGVERGFLWQVSSPAGHRLYLFGTVHLGKPDFFPLGGQVEQALHSSDVIAVEVDPSQTTQIMAAVKQHSLYAEPQALRAKLSPALADRLAAVCKRLNFPLQAAWQFKPLMLSTTLAGLEAGRGGYDFSSSVENYLAAWAKVQGKPIAEVEGIEAQLAVLNSFPESVGLEVLEQTLGEFEAGKMSQEIDRLIQAWARSDLALLEKLALEVAAAPGQGAQLVQVEILDKRNHRMAERLQQYLSSGKTYFVAVGSFHMVGKTGLPSLLAQQGHHITQLVPAQP